MVTHKKNRLLPGIIACGLAVIALWCGVMVSVKADTAESLHVEAKSALLMDYHTGTVVYAQNEKEHLPIASMVKIMTMLLALEDMDAGKLSPQDSIRASEYAASMGGSQAFLDAGSSYTADELLKSIAVGSANDSCVAVAEHLAGSVEAFVARMNERATQLGMHDTYFVNCTGLPAAEQYCCAYDAALMLRALIAHERFFGYSGIWMFDFAHPSGRVTQLSNTNKLLRAYEGCDGGKTGFTNEAKYCLAATAKRNNTRLISVVCGAQSSKIRNAQNAALFNYGFAHYETKQVVTAGVPLTQKYAVSGGKEEYVLAVPERDAFVFARKGQADEYDLRAETVRIAAPVRCGDVIGVLRVMQGDSVVRDVNLCSDRTVKRSTYMDTVDDFIAQW